MSTTSRLVVLVALALIGVSCESKKPEPKRTGFTFAPAGSSAPRGACTFGADQTCNDDPEVSSVNGTCNQDGTCTCRPGYRLSATTGRCKM